MVCFFEFLTPFILGGHNFFISNLFSMIITMSDASRGGVQVLFAHHNQLSPPLGSGLPWALKCSVTSQSTLCPFSSNKLNIKQKVFLSLGAFPLVLVRPMRSSFLSLGAFHLILVRPMWSAIIDPGSRTNYKIRWSDIDSASDTKSCILFMSNY
jgi:hypothetical protein